MSSNSENGYIAISVCFCHLLLWDLLNLCIMHLLAVGMSICSAMIRETIKAGRIVPSEVTVGLICKAIESSKNNKILIDGFPRSNENRIAFERIVSFFFNVGGILLVRFCCICYFIFWSSLLALSYTFNMCFGEISYDICTILYGSIYFQELNGLVIVFLWILCRLSLNSFLLPCRFIGGHKPIVSLTRPSCDQHPLYLLALVTSLLTSIYKSYSIYIHLEYAV